MNGEVNGTMQEPMDTSLPGPLINQKIHTSADVKSAPKHNEESNSSVDRSPLESEANQDPFNRDMDTSEILASIEMEDQNSNDSNISNPGKPTSNQSLGNCSEPTNDHCSLSNESDPESMTSSKARLETTDHQIMQNMDEKHKDNNLKSYVNSNEAETDEVDSEEDSSDEEGSVVSVGPRAEDTVSINSDSEPDGGDETSQESETKNKNNSDIIIIENDNIPDNQNGNSNGSGSPEIHEIPSDNDDCVLPNDDESNSSTNENKTVLRRSNRAIKRKRYDTEEMINGDDESDIEEVEMEDPLSHKTKRIIINDTKTLVEMASKKMKSNQKNENTVVIIDTNSGKGSSTNVKSSSINMSASAQNLYQSIIARGTTVTPVSSKTSTTVQSTPQNSQVSILPSLTDDMFVVEAPSFIVPYVYEKPSLKPFREFVDILGKELEEQKAKEEKERLDKEKTEKDNYDKEKREKGEDVSESEEEMKKTKKASEIEEEEKKKKKAEKRERKRRRNDDDDASWDGESSSDSEDETLSDDDTVVLTDKAESIEGIKDASDLTVSKVIAGKSDNYFDCSLGKFFVDIGLNLVQEYVQTDLLKQQNRKLSREKKSGHSTKATESSIASLMKNLEFSKENNAPYSFTQKKCEFCSFKTESALAMNHHLETPHMKNNLYKCNFCEFEIRSPHDILCHMEAQHNVRGKLERAPAYHQCPDCPFEDNGKGKLARHQIACAKKFKPELNLAPPIEWEPPAKIPKITRSRNNMTGTYQNAFNRQVGNNLGRPPINIANMMPGAGGGFRARGRSPMAVPPRAAPVHGAPVVRGGIMIRHNAPILMPNNYPTANNGKSKALHQPSISITPLPRQPQPVLPQPNAQTKNTFVICEICDGYIKDLEQLRNHMQWIHKVKIHPKMIYNRPPLNCQKCQFRFFTDQGLERHLLGSHGLVTSSMQEAANKGKDAGRCPVCGRVYQWKLLNHVARDHNLTLKPAHLSYKCTVCTATFGMYKQFENHVYSAHSVVAKRVIDKSKTTTAPAKNSNDSLLKPLKINDEITIIPQPVKPATSAKDKK